MNTSDFFYIDDFFSDPYSVRQDALNLQFFPREVYGETQQDGSIIAPTFPQLRTLNMFYDEVGQKLNNMFDTINYCLDQRFNYCFNVVNDDTPDNWIHIDALKYKADFLDVKEDKPFLKNAWAGLVYLTPEPLEFSGTVLYHNKKLNTHIVDPEKKWDVNSKNPDEWSVHHTFENKFNRAVFYKANIFHNIEKTFGSTLEESRLTYNMWFTGLYK